MIRLLAYLAISLAIAAGLAYIFGTEGSILIQIGSLRLQPSLGTAAVTLILFVMATMIIWALLRHLINAPASIAKASARNNVKKANIAMTNSIIALEAGDAQKARNLAREARARQPENLAAHLLEARSSLSLGEWSSARDEYRVLLENPDTALAALSGLHEQAKAQNRPDAALTFATKAQKLAPSLEWANSAVLKDLTDRQAWDEALALVSNATGGSKAERDQRIRHQVVLNTALAAQKETTQANDAAAHANTALKLEPAFVPAALVLARVQSSKGEVRKASSMLKRVWQQTAHPHVATLYAYAQLGNSAEKRLARLAELMPSPPPDEASAIVFAQIAVEAGEWVKARNALAGYAGANPTKDMCLLMAEIEEGQNHDHGRAREWLAKAVNAPRDAVWTADGATFEEWQPTSPISGRLDALEFKVPLAKSVAIGHSDDAPDDVAPEDVPALPGETAKPVN